MTLTDHAAKQDGVDKDERTLAAVRRENATLRSQNKALEESNGRLAILADLVGRFEESAPEPPVWLSPKKPRSSHATLMLLLSDLHLDEVVKPEEMDGLNAYDRQIATVRIETWVRKVIKLSRHYLAGVTYDGVVVMLGGDTFSGTIHDELRETNVDTLFKSLLYWVEIILAALNSLADEFGKVHVVAVPGNHGRMTKKARFKGRAADNVDWLLGKLLERDCRSDRRITFQVPDSFDAHFTVYGRGQLLTHGDQVNGGGGIGGIWPPIMRMRAKKAQVHMEIGKPFATLWCGHWHQLIPTPGLVINGSLKGWDEYAKGNNFVPEPAQQAMAIMTPENGISWQCPVLCSDRKKEGW